MIEKIQTYKVKHSGARVCVAIPIEIKSGETRTSDYFKNFEYWNKVSDVKGPIKTFIYAWLKKVETTAVTYVPFDKYEFLL